MYKCPIHSFILLLPFFCSGGRGADPRRLAGDMKNAISRFASAKPKTVKEIRIVVFNKELFSYYTGAFGLSSEESISGRDYGDSGTN